MQWEFDCFSLMLNTVKEWGIPIFCTKSDENFGNSSVFFTLATEKK